MPQEPPEASDPLKERLDLAVALHQRGALADAEALYTEILRQQPRHFDALHLLGVVATQTQRIEQGAALIEQAIAVRPDFAEAHNNLGLALSRLDRLQDALAAFDAAIALNPNHAWAHGNRDNVRRELGRRRGQDRGVAAIPPESRSADAHNLAGLRFSLLKRFEEAVASFDAAIALVPDDTEAHNNRGNALRELRRHDEALASFDRVIALKPDHAAAYNNRGLVLKELRRYEEALASCATAIALKPDYADAHSNRGNALCDLARYEEALAAQDAAVALAPDNAGAHSNRGVVLTHLQQYAQALAAFDTALALKAEYAEAHNNRANVLRDLRRHEEALAGYDRAIALQPDYADAHSNRGNMLDELQRNEEAVESYDRAIALKPDSAEGYLNKSLCLLQMGQLEEGWRLYEWRKKSRAQTADRSYRQPLWHGREEIAGKTLFLYAEQGFGDTLQFCRYAGLVRALGARVILSVQDPLLRLLGQLAPEIAVIGAREEPQTFDCHSPLMSLPHALGTTLATIPATPRYLAADRQLRDRWTARLPSRGKPRIGLVWRGSPTHKNDRSRSLSLATMLPLLREDAEWISLQKEFGAEEEALLLQDGRITAVGGGLEDFADTAAVIESMDLVVTVDTSVAHLAGAMGKPVWILLPYNPDWRWLTDRDDSPWYPSARLFRQSESGNWEGVVDAVRRALPDILTGGRRATSSALCGSVTRKTYVGAVNGTWIEVSAAAPHPHRTGMNGDG